MEEVLENIRQTTCMAFEIITSTDDDIEFEVYGVSLAWNEGNGVYIPIGHEGCSLDEAEVFKTLKPVMEDGRIQKLGHHLKQDIIALAKWGIGLVNYTFDPKCLHISWTRPPAATNSKI